VSPQVKDYTRDLAARAKGLGQAQKVMIPNLGAAAAEYRPEKDGPMTLSKIAEAQENIRTMDENDRKPSLSAETIQGLQALHQQTAAQQRPPTPPPAQPQVEVPAAEMPKSAEGKKSVTKLSDDEAQRLTETSDIDFDLMMQRLRNDVLNNEDERKAVEARVKEMNLTDGLVSGEFKQLVPIMPGKLEVVFRSISPLENEEIRQKLLEQQLEDEKLANSSVLSERYGFMQTVAAVHSINGQEMPKHLGSDKGIRVFKWDTFQKKVQLFMGYPSPFIHSLSTHAYWFDLRVRKLFSSTALKNG
jgi:hypothetical protein